MSYAGGLGTHCAGTPIHSSQSSFQSVAHFVYESCRVRSHHSYSCLFQSVCCFALYLNPAGVLSHHSYSCLFQSVCCFALCMNPAEVQVTILIHVCFDLLLLVLYMNPASVKSPFFVMFVSICCILGCV